jgi:sugar phosphate isomerase/epimerase
LERIGIENISVFGLPPVACVNLAADLGCHHISMTLFPFDYNPHGYPRYSLKEDAALRRDMVAAMRERAVSISLGEVFAARADTEVRDWAADLGAMAELGIRRVNTLSLDPDLRRSFDKFGELTEMAAADGMETTVEFTPGLTVADLPTAIAAVRHVGRADFRLLIDTMHFIRSGSRPEDLAAIDPDTIGYVQICDAPLVPKIANYFEEAKYERMVPGTGELPLFDILAAVPRDRIIGIEVPLRSQADAGIGPFDRLRPCVVAARDLLTRLDAKPAESEE